MMQISCQFEIRLPKKIREFRRNRRICGDSDVDLVTKLPQNSALRSKSYRKSEKTYV